MVDLGISSILVYSFGSALAASLAFMLFLHHQSEVARRKLHHAEGRMHKIQEHLEHASISLIRARKALRGKASLRDAEEKISRAVTELLSAAEEEQQLQASQSASRRRTR